MSNWWYVAIAYTVVWGALAVYAVLLARRVTQAQEIARRLEESVREDDAPGDALQAHAPQTTNGV